MSIVVCAFALCGWLLNRYAGGLGYQLYGAAGGLVAAMPICWAISYALIPRRARRLFRQQRTENPSYTWRWSDVGLESSSANGESRYRWSELHCWLDGHRSLMFFLNDTFVLYIPLRVLGPDQAADLRALATRAQVPPFSGRTVDRP